MFDKEIWKEMARDFLAPAVCIVIILFYVGCTSSAPKTYTHVEGTRTTTFDLRWGDIERFVDTEAGVVCWIHTGEISTKGSISCLSLSETKLDY